MTPKTWCRSLAVLSALFAIGHTIGTTAPQPSRGATEEALFQAMQTFRFPIMGFTRSHWDFYQGFALDISVLVAMMAVIAWQLPRVSDRDPLAALPIAISLLAGWIGVAVLGFVYFFAIPIVMSVMACALCAGVVMSMSRLTRAAA
jgi:hypothetical protein